MRKNIVGVVGLSGLLFLGPAPSIVLAHQGDDHGAHHRDRQSGYSEQEDDYGRSAPQYDEEQGRYRGEREESGRYAPPRGDEEEDGTYDDDEEEDTYRSSSGRYPALEREQSSPREQRGGPR